VPGDTGADVERRLRGGHPVPGLDLRIKNRGRSGAKVHVYDAYRRQTIVQFIGEGDEWKRHFPLAGSFGWADLTVQVGDDGTFVHRVAGQVETGDESATDPLIGAGP
jgi:hypothetical protein